MSYTVVWHAEAEDELAQIWLEYAPQSSITSAANRIDELLRAQPTEVGESRPNDRRILLVPPLGVTYRVRQPDRFVHVLRVWYYEGPKE